MKRVLTVVAERRGGNEDGDLGDRHHSAEYRPERGMKSKAFRHRLDPAAVLLDQVDHALRIVAALLDGVLERFL